ncbi:MAG TPA: hypothetical protein VGJ94_04430 [Syntrophorhabdaceae bacterium]
MLSSKLAVLVNPTSRWRESFILVAPCEHHWVPLGEEKRSEGQPPMFEEWNDELGG